MNRAVVSAIRLSPDKRRGFENKFRCLELPEFSWVLFKVLTLKVIPPTLFFVICIAFCSL